MQNESEVQIGKALGLRLYLHVDAIPSASAEHQELITRAQSAGDIGGDAFNVVRVNAYASQVSFLLYPRFFEDPFPALLSAIAVDLKRSRQNKRSYQDSLNPPILHRKELLLPPEHPAKPQFQALTASLEALGVFQTAAPIGFKRQWTELLADTGYSVDGHTLVPIGNRIFVNPTDDPTYLPPAAAEPIARHLTALSRDRLSAPLRFLETFGFLNGSFSVFDYGCGKGDDLKYLQSINVPSNGWDPHFRPNDPLIPADFVNLGFVINVIEDLAERQYALTRAYSLARNAIVVSTMLTSDQRKEGRSFRDGYISSIGTFQKYYLQHELQSFIDGVLDESPIPLGPGVFIVFKNKEAEASFLASRVRSYSRAKMRFAIERRECTHETRRHENARELLPRQKELLDALWSQMLDLGRAPIETEVKDFAELTQHFGSYRSALKAIRDRYDLDELAESASQRRNEILVMLAIHHFRRTSRTVVMDSRLRNDILALFGSIRSAQQNALELIASLRQEETLKNAIQWSLENGIGTLIDDKGFIVHRSLITRLPPQLQVTVWAAGLLGDGLEASDLIRVHDGEEKVSFYRYDNFDREPLPRLRHQCKVDIKRLKTTDRYVSEDQNVKLIGKSRFLNEESSLFSETQEFDQNLFKITGEEFEHLHMQMNSIAPKLREALYEIEGHKLVRSERTPDLDENCGRFLRYRDLIHCGETQAALKIDNLPDVSDSYVALYELATNILDPVIEYFGSIRLTYGFCSNDLRKHIKGRVAPHLDQHAAHELDSKHKLICSRLGAAVDFVVDDENMYEVVKWIHDNLEFDRIYYYGPDRPIHVSFNDRPVREITELRQTKTGRQIPRKLEV